MSMQAGAGVARLARFRADGLRAFEATPGALLNALTPWLAFALVGFVLMVVAGSARQALGDLLASVVALLTPPVVSQALARLWGRQEAWLRYAVAFTWCQWVMPVALLASLMASGLLMAAGLPESLAELFAALSFLVYAVSLHGFVIRSGLALSRWRTAVMLLAINLGTVAAVLVPTLLNEVMEAAG
jgi:hypothetical protein